MPNDKPSMFMKVNAGFFFRFRMADTMRFLNMAKFF